MRTIWLRVGDRLELQAADETTGAPIFGAEWAAGSGAVSLADLGGGRVRVEAEEPGRCAVSYRFTATRRVVKHERCEVFVGVGMRRRGTGGFVGGQPLEEFDRFEERVLPTMVEEAFTGGGSALVVVYDPADPPALPPPELPTITIGGVS